MYILSNNANAFRKYNLPEKCMVLFIRRSEVVFSKLCKSFRSAAIVILHRNGLFRLSRKGTDIRYKRHAALTIHRPT